MTAGVPNPSGATGVVALAEPEATALFARGGFSSARRERINRYIRRWKVAGCWANVLGLWFFAAESRDQALLNWATTGADAVVAGSPEPTFTVDKGFSGLTASKTPKVPWDPAALGGTNFAIGFAGLIDASLTGSSDTWVDRRILCPTDAADNETAAIILDMYTSPTKINNIVTNRATERLSLVVRRQNHLLGETDVGYGLTNSSTLSAGYIRGSKSTTRIGILKRWAGIAILKHATTDAQARAFSRIWNDLIAETGALD